MVKFTYCLSATLSSVGSSGSVVSVLVSVLFDFVSVETC